MKRCGIILAFVLCACLLCGCGATKEEADVKNEEAALRQRIGDLAYEVTQNAATERAFTGEYDDFFEKGL